MRCVNHCALICFALCCAVTATAADNSGDAILGKWWFPEKNGKMEVYRQGAKYFGKVIAYDDPDALDENNPDEKLRTRKFVGIVMLENFTYDAGDEQWAGGTIYDGDSGKTYKCKMWFEDAAQQKLKVRGFIGVSLFGRTEIFQRVTKEDEVQEAAAETKAAEATDE